LPHSCIALLLVEIFDFENPLLRLNISPSNRSNNLKKSISAFSLTNVSDTIHIISINPSRSDGINHCGDILHGYFSDSHSTQRTKRTIKRTWQNILLLKSRFLIDFPHSMNIWIDLDSVTDFDFEFGIAIQDVSVVSTNNRISCVQHFPDQNPCDCWEGPLSQIRSNLFNLI
jgi:hypothetical protein